MCFASLESIWPNAAYNHDCCSPGEDVEAVAEKLENQTAATQAMREQLEAQSAELAAARASKNELASEVATLRAEKEAVSNAQARQQGAESPGTGVGIKRTTGSGRLARVRFLFCKD